ncbi:MAG: hypothetical protein GVY19_01220 [Bacteroidetes bacterium]|nr:hypothetical protein [Bacteroidota bacterium]
MKHPIRLFPHRKSILFVAIQMACIVFFVLTGPFFAHRPVTLIIELLGIFLGIWSVVIMIPHKISVYPDVQDGAKLLQKGPYKIIRHPMYTALFVTFLPLIIDYFTWIRLAVFAIFVFNQIGKMIYEESLLMNHFSDYHVYKTKTYRVIPYIW